ncbi:UDP-N-acetylmuramoyl-L-alanine--D-glutamate ligase [Curtanaerobium respiraculi]|uniref:UDP-N-acetylmuramoyl-L-alanine--D-glutamate ligase n=1 Tax=Curtanaerobium respiraculi TaxID=2949669 RepID=UPI0024B3972E|nr:UDP-N-acetylmuramoyl-L-alanine--D-glutamate ligase [Curtanaerobium respiraculi]
MAGRKKAPENLGHVLILGLGRSGKAACAYCTALLGTRTESVTVAAGRSTDEARLFARRAEESGAEVVFDSEAIDGSYDLCIASPGISEFSSFYLSAKAASAEIVSEVEFAWRESAQDSVWIAITGTNGKTTTTSLCAHILKGAGMNAAAVGNIGDTCLGAVAARSTDIYVAEVSSYQLASTRDFAPQVAVLMNITPDHVAWHRTHENYVAAKCKILANLPAVPGSVAVLDATNGTVRAKVREIKAIPARGRGFDYIPVGTAEGISGDMRAACGSENAAFLRADGMLAVCRSGEEAELVPATDLQIPGAHNQSNALMAAAAALCVGAGLEDVRSGLRSFASLEHRIEPCGSVRGVACYNDSKATNVDATLKALSAFSPRKPIVLLGGDDKLTDLDELVASSERHCKAVVCFGASRERFLDSFDGAALPVIAARHMEDALDAALACAAEGDIVLLSPACASFDEFDGFEQRGTVFKRLVAERARA